ncbi:MAG: cytochrome C peroxidase [Lewinella sp.]|nr:cytochrome C peroxidase [Lewinella sp.]
MKRSYRYWFLVAGMVLLMGFGCRPDEKPACTNCPEDDLIQGTYDPTAYNLDLPPWMGTPLIPADNPLTNAGVELGRFLFYDPILSADSTLSCAGCHKITHSFTDDARFSKGVLGLEGTRNSMPLINLAFNPNGFFWDGRAGSLEDQVLVPVEDHKEMNETWDHVAEKLRAHKTYPAMFRKAFGIERKKEITKELTGRAIAQFERTLVSYQSKFDNVAQLNQGWLTDSEERGKDLFYVEPNDPTHPGCSHCHGGINFTDFTFRNNGLDDVSSLDQFPDLGLGGHTGNFYDNGKFKVPSLRNVALTAPYMHDGRFQTLEEVLENYSAGGHNVENEDVNIRPFPLSAQQKQDMIRFLQTLTDTSYIHNPAFSNPFN